MFNILKKILFGLYAFAFGTVVLFLWGMVLISIVYVFAMVTQSTLHPSFESRDVPCDYLQYGDC